jgi:hypothetical protein
MTQCPKCGGWKISGPQYVKHLWGYERLRYWCETCGYSCETPTRDSADRVKGKANG